MTYDWRIFNNSINLISLLHRALLYGGLQEAHQSEIKLTNVPLEPFKILLKYVYSGKISLGQMKDEKIFDLLGLANQVSNIW